MEQKPKRKKQPKAPRQKMREQPSAVRIHNYDEVAFGYTEEQARQEAQRCLDCKKPLCVKGCPVGIDIPAFVRLIAEGKFEESADRILAMNALPAVCGRVCPQETQCEGSCVVGKKAEPIAIGTLERFAADYKREHATGEPAPRVEPNGLSVAVVGSGPAGLTCAGELANRGYQVTVFEALHKPGGVLFYGIPEFRLPKQIVMQEVEALQARGVTLVYDTVIGKQDSVDELLEKFDAVFIGSGAGLPSFMNVPGENLVGVFSANEYLTRANLMGGYDRSRFDTPMGIFKKVAVIGGGNVAMDSARTALRMGADRVHIVYRRAREQMPGRAEEIHHAEQEGVQFDLLTAPKRVLGDDRGRVIGMECIRMELGEPDASGRRRPVPMAGSEFTFDVDMIVVAIGNKPNPIVPATTPDIEVSRWGTIVADEANARTSKPCVWAGGDIVTGAATVISAMGAGKAAAADMHAYLTSPKPRQWLPAKDGSSREA